MPANVESMAYSDARGVPWHGIGTAVDHLMTADEAIIESGLDWSVAMEPIYLSDGTVVDRRQALVRQDNRQTLGVHGMTYAEVQNRGAFDFADGLVADTGNKYDTAGSLDEGRTIFLSMELSAVAPITIAGDSEFQTFLLLSNSHDGTKALRATITPVRVVCANTLNFAMGRNSGVFTIRHSGDINAKMKAAQDALGISVDYMRRFEDVANALIETKVSDDFATKVIRDAFAMRETTEAKGPDSDWFANHAAVQVMDRYTDAADLAAFRGTGWGVVNAVAEYIDHDRSYGKGTDREALDVKMTSVIWGQGANTVNRAVSLVSPDAAALMSNRVNRSAKSHAKRTAVAVA